MYHPHHDEPGLEILTERVDREYSDGKTVKVYDLEFMNGEIWRNEPLWSVSPAAAGLLLDLDGRRIGLVQQARLGAGGRTLLEAVAGGVDDGEDPLQAFAREAEEETGIRPSTLAHVATLYVSPGRTDEVKTLAIGTGMTPGTRTEGDEIETVWVPLTDLDELIDATADGGDQTLLTLLLWLWRDLTRNHPELLAR